MPLLRTSLLVILSTLILCVVVPAQPNPFTGDNAPAESPGNREQPAPPAQPTDAAPPSLFGGRPAFPRLNAILTNQQRILNNRIAELIHSHSAAGAGTGGAGGTGDPGGTGGAGGSSWGLLPAIGLVAFVYGLVHAALPGHRKVLLVSYFVATDAPFRHAVIAGVSVAALHAGAAAGVILTAYYVLQASLGATLSNATAYLQGVTSVVVLLLGVVVLVSTIREALHHLREHGPETEHEPSRLSQFFRNRLGLLPAIVLSAVVPDAGSAMILLFAISLGVVSLGLYAVVIFSLGMAVTQTAVLAAAVLSKRAVTGALDGRLGEIVHIGIEGLGGVAMIGVGAVLLLSVL
jgi:ABC-type nickel/cobalt efflux system permease component RcnA